MKFQELLEIVGDEPVFASSLLRVGDVDPTDVGSQLSRWVASERIVRLRRGVYALSSAYRKREVHPFEVANRLVEPSYVSLESALSFYGLIPEAVFSTTSVTTARPARFETALGRYAYRHLTPELMWGYRETELGASGRATALVARPEKALLDLAYLRPGGDAPEFLRQLRLERLGMLDLEVLNGFARRSGKPKLERAALRIVQMAEESRSKGETA